MLRCEVGDLSGKHARLNVGFGKQFYTDPDLPLFGEMSGKTVLRLLKFEKCNTAFILFAVVNLLYPMLSLNSFLESNTEKCLYSLFLFLFLLKRELKIHIISVKRNCDLRYQTQTSHFNSAGKADAFTLSPPTDSPSFLCPWQTEIAHYQFKNRQCLNFCKFLFSTLFIGQSFNTVV